MAEQNGTKEQNGTGASKRGNETLIATGQYVSWYSTQVEQSTGTQKYMGADGKEHTRRTGVKEVEYVFPKINLQAVKDPSDVVWLIEEIVNSNREGFKSFNDLLNRWQYGLYSELRASISRGGASASRLPHHRELIRMYSNMYSKFGLDRAVAVDSLRRQGIDDAEEIIAAIDNKTEQQAAD